MLGQANFIPGFEEGLIGAKAGEERDINATFPDDYHGRRADGQGGDLRREDQGGGGTRAPGGRRRLRQDARRRGRSPTCASWSASRSPRVRQRRAHEAEAPDAGPAREGAHVRAAAVARRQRVRVRSGGSSPRPCASRASRFADEGKTEEEARAEYRRIAERRVRLGLVIGEIAEKNDIKITQDELRRVADRAGSAFPGPGEGGLRVLREDPRGARRAARAHLRGQGRRFHHRKGQADREEGVEGRCCLSSLRHADEHVNGA